MEAILRSTSSGSIANALELVVASISNPTELNSIGTSVPDWRLCRTNVAGSDQATLYRLDADTDGVAAPYIMASATAGLRWVAIAGAYLYGSITASTSQVGSSIIGTGTAASSVSIGGGNLYAGGGILLGQGTAGAANYLIVNGGGSGSAAGAALLFRNNGSNIFQLGNKSSILGGAYDATCYMQPTGVMQFAGVLNVTDTSTPSSTLTGALRIGDGVTSSTNVGIGGGKIYTGDTILHHTSVALANGAGASAGTITNAPSAGNPTKWIGIDDNGTTRYVPAW